MATYATSLTRPGLRGILTAERLKRVRKEDIQEFVDKLLGDLKTLSK